MDKDKEISKILGQLSETRTRLIDENCQIDKFIKFVKKY